MSFSLWGHFHDIPNTLLHPLHPPLQVDRPGFPCTCTAEGCLNKAGRLEFNPVKVGGWKWVGGGADNLRWIFLVFGRLTDWRGNVSGEWD